MPDLKPKDDGAAKPAAEATPPEEGTVKDRQAHVFDGTEKKDADKEISMSKTISPLDDMLGVTGENPEEAKPWESLIEEEDRPKEEAEGEERPPAEEAPLVEKPPKETPPAEEESPKPAEGTEPPEKDGQQAERIKAAGEEFENTVAGIKKLAESYTQLHREFHNRNFQSKQEKIKGDARVLKLRRELKFLEQSYATNLSNMAEAGKSPSSGKTPPKAITKEQFEEAVDDGRGFEVMQEMIEARTAGIRQEIEAERPATGKSGQNELDAAGADIDTEADATIIRNTLEEAAKQDDMKSFEENRKPFGNWLEKIYGKDYAGLKKINEICSDLPMLKERFQTFLKDTFDYKSAIQEAVSKGQETGSRKEKLTPVPGSAPPAQPEKERQKLKPKDQEETDFMEMDTQLAGGNRGRFFHQKTGLFQ